MQHFEKILNKMVKMKVRWYGKILFKNQNCKHCLKKKSKHHKRLKTVNCIKVQSFSCQVPSCHILQYIKMWKLVFTNYFLEKKRCFRHKSESDMELRQVSRVGVIYKGWGRQQLTNRVRKRVSGCGPSVMCQHYSPSPSPPTHCTHSQSIRG